MSRPLTVPALRPDNFALRQILVAGCAAVCVVSILALDPARAAVVLALGPALVLTLRVPLAGLVLIAFAVPWLGGVDVIPAPFTTTPVDLLVAALGVAWLVRAALDRTNPMAVGLWTPYIVLYLLAIGLSVTQASDWHASLREIVKWAELLVVFCAAETFLRGDRALRVVAAAITAAGVSQAALGYVQFFFGLGPEAFAAHRFALRAFGSFDQPNPFAGFLNMTLPFALTLGILGRPGKERTAYRAATVIIFGAILASQSRGALLAGVTACCVVGALMLPRLRPIFWFGILCGALAAWLAALGAIPVSPFQRVLSAVGLANVSFGSVTDANFSAVERAAHWLAGVRMFADHPLLGVGIGNYSVAYPHYHPRGWYASLEHAHNYLINIAAEAGVVGLTAYVLLAGSALWYSCAAIRVSSNRRNRAVSLAVLGALIATSLHNLFDVLYVHGMVAFLGLLVAFVPVAIRSASTPGTEMGQGHRG